MVSKTWPGSAFAIRLAMVLPFKFQQQSHRNFFSSIKSTILLHPCIYSSVKISLNASRRDHKNQVAADWKLLEEITRDLINGPPAPTDSKRVRCDSDGLYKQTMITSKARCLFVSNICCFFLEIRQFTLFVTNRIIFLQEVSCDCGRV